MLGGLLEITQSSLCAAHYLALQAPQLLAPVSGELSGLFLDSANIVFEGAVDLVRIHGGLSSSRWSVWCGFKQTAAPCYEEQALLSVRWHTETIVLAPACRAGSLNIGGLRIPTPSPTQCARDNDLMTDELPTHRAALARLDRYATLMDARFRVPGTRIRFGLDPIIGLLPGIGDALGLALSLYVVVEAIRLGASKRVLFGMLRNVGLEALVGMVPVLGDVFDIGFKANLRNAALLRSYIEDRLRPAPVRASRRWLQWVLLAAFAALILGLLLVLTRMALTQVT